MSELGAGTEGSSDGYSAIASASYRHPMDSIDVFDSSNIIKVDTVKSLGIPNPDFEHSKNLNEIVTMYNRISVAIENSILDNKFPVVISGDHSNAGGTIRGLKKSYINSRIGLIWIDAHADLHSPFTTPSGNVHGMPVATAIKENNIDSAINKPSDEIIDLWGQLLGDERRVIPSDIVYVGLRSVEDAESFLIHKYGMGVHTVNELRDRGVDRVINDIETQLDNCDVIYVSFDVDSMDPSVSNGTGTPVENGLKKLEALELLKILASHSKVKCIEFTEINPSLDSKGNPMGEVAGQLLRETINCLNKRLSK
tara:strand:- start:1744 stop:2676 length:933 start_codon:yes stop_codon:yes gene_type:complete